MYRTILKIIGMLLMLLTTTLPAIAIEITNQEESIVVTPSGGGIFDAQGDESLHSMVGQAAIGYDAQGDESLGVGLLWLAQSLVESAFSSPAQLFQIFIKDYDINWITVNWTG